MRFETLAYGYGLIEGPRVDGGARVRAAPRPEPEVQVILDALRTTTGVMECS